MVVTKYLSIETRGNTDIKDITARCQDILEATEFKSGVVTVFNPGSTGGLTTIEYEPNLLKDFKEALEVVAPSDKVYEHSKTWHDDNGSSHIRSSLMGPSIAVPFVNGKLTLGTWQQIVFCDFDTHPRKRRLVVQVVGE
ncbi:MAG: YjbQ family protein [Candidatus Makaraimicrobium thalassicum]|nr:MAG: YjbQ family protein [Candidatus Omnitrophota bacterium]